MAPTQEQARAGRSRIQASVATVLLFAFILAVTRANVLGDTPLYANQIVEHWGQSPLGSGNSLWDAGHLLWRPLGWALLSVLWPVLSALTNMTPVMAADFLLIAIGVISALATVWLWRLLIIDWLPGSPRLAIWLPLAFACTHAVILYAHSGSSYVPGLACTTASLYSLRRSRFILGATWFALATLLWLPYILAGPALAFVAICPAAGADWLRTAFSASKLRPLLTFIAVSAVLTGITYGLALIAVRTSSTADARAWLSQSSHGWSQNITIVRIATGLPRSFYYMGKDGVLFRRYLRHDPYNRVTIASLVKASLWKIAAFALFVAALFYELARRPGSAWIVLLFFLAATPVVGFAVLLFEPGSPERYLPALSFLFLATAWVLRDFGRVRGVGQLLIVLCLIAAAANNVYAFLRPRISEQDRATLARVAGLRDQLGGAGFVAVLSNQDDLDEVINRSPFSAINRPAPLRVYDVIEVATTRVIDWREQFARHVLDAWSRGGEVWVSKRFWRDKPLPGWDWVEGDDPRISWPQIPRFFTGLQTDADSGGPDGFLRLTPNEANRTRLAAIAGSRAGAQIGQSRRKVPNSLLFTFLLLPEEIS